MWTLGNDGAVFWTDPAKMLLVGLLTQNVEAISSNRFCPGKPAAWKRVYDALVKAGMPKTSNIIRVKKCWARLVLAAKAQHNEQMKKFSRSGSKTPLSKLNQAIINLLNGVNSSNIQDMMPKVCASVFISRNMLPKLQCILFSQPKMEIKTEPVENGADHKNIEPRPKRLRLSERNLNPVVKLDRIVLNNNVVQPKPTENVPSTEYWNLMKQIAENELKLKLAQRENEEERMEIEREIHRKNVILMDLKIKVQQMQIEALQGQALFE